MPDKTLTKIIVITIIAAVVLSALFLLRQIKVMDIQNKTAALEESIRKLQYENEKLEIELARYTGLEYIDTQATHRLKMIRPAKVHFVLQNNPEASR